MSDLKCPNCGDDIQYPWKHSIKRVSRGGKVECNSDTARCASQPAGESINLDSITMVVPLEQLIGTETCGYCYTLTECLSLPSDGDTERRACRYCVARAFDDVLGGPIHADGRGGGNEFTD